MNNMPNALADKLTAIDAEVDAIVAFLETLEGQGYQDKAPQAFPQ